MDTSETLIIVFNSLSLLGSLFIIFSYWSLQKNLAYKTIFALTFSVLVNNALNFVIKSGDSGLCEFQSVVRQFAMVSYVMWIMGLLYVYLWISKLRSSPSTLQLTERLMKMIIFVGGTSILLTILPLATGSYGEMDNSFPHWCWINKSVWQYVCFYLPVWCCILWMFYVYYRVYSAKAVDDNDNDNDDKEDQKVLAVYKTQTMLRLRYYPLVMFCFFIATFCLITDSATNLGLVMMSLHGLLNCLIYICIKDVRDSVFCYEISEMNMLTVRQTSIPTANESKQINVFIVLYNGRSGAQKAKLLIREFQKFNSITFDLFELNDKSEPNQHMIRFARLLEMHEKHVIVCIAGGDGSQGWACSLIDRALSQTTRKGVSIPYIVPFPVGTGNDLCRTLGWGHVEPKISNIFNYISDVYYCFENDRVSYLDRWKVEYELDDEDDASDYISSFPVPLSKNFLCYLSFGYDAQVTVDFLENRNANPEKFDSQLKGKIQYFKIGLSHLTSPIDTIDNNVECYINDEKVSLPDGQRSLKLMNINSGADGVFFWGTGKSKASEFQQITMPQFNDGLIEVISTIGPLGLSAAKMTVKHGHRISQSNQIKFKVVKTPCFMQIDGEGYKIEKKLTITVSLNEPTIPIVVGFNESRGAGHRFDNAYIHQVNLKKDRAAFRKNLKIAKVKVIEINDDVIDGDRKEEESPLRENTPENDAGAMSAMIGMTNESTALSGMNSDDERNELEKIYSEAEEPMEAGHT